MKLAINFLLMGLLMPFIVGCGDPGPIRETTYQLQPLEKHDFSIAIVSDEYPKLFGWGTENAPPTIVITEKNGTGWKIDAHSAESEYWHISRLNPSQGHEEFWVRASTLPQTVKENK